MHCTEKENPKKKTDDRFSVINVLVIDNDLLFVLNVLGLWLVILRCFRFSSFLLYRFVLIPM